MTKNYYVQSLNAQKLYQIYETKYPRVRKYLEAEIDFVRNYLQGTENVLELGAGYGRIVKELAPSCKSIAGIDISKDNVDFGKEYLSDTPNANLMVMDAHNLQFQELFDVALCLQNALSAMKVEPVEFIQKVMNLLSYGGKAFFSSYRLIPHTCG